MNWLNEKSWKNIPTEASTVEQKKLTLQALSLMHSFDTNFSSQEDENFFNSICVDIDCCAYLLSRYAYQQEKVEKLSNIKKHFNNPVSAKYLLSQGLHYNLEEYLFNKYPEFKENKDLAFQLLKRNYRSAKYFLSLLSEYKFIEKCLKNNIVCIEFLKAFPEDETITKKLLLNHYFPDKNTQHLFNHKVMSDKTFIMPILMENRGHYLYPYLPDELRCDVVLCDTIKEKHPHLVVEASSINTVEKFIELLNSNKRFSKEIYNLIENIKRSDFIMKDSLAVARVLKTMGENGCECYVDLMSDPQFYGHPIQNFLNECAKNHPVIKDFLNTSDGKEIMTFKVKNYKELRDFEAIIFPNLGNKLYIYLLVNKLNASLPQKKSATKKKI